MYMHYLYSFYKTYWFLSQERVLKIRTLAFFFQNRQTNLLRNIRKKYYYCHFCKVKLIQQNEYMFLSCREYKQLFL